MTSRAFYFTPSYFCTSDCVMCGVDKVKRDSKMGYTLEAALSAIDRTGLKPGDILEISGGEPTAYKYLPDICRYASGKYGAKVLVLSHGRHFKNARLTERLTHCNITRFIIPIFSHQHAVHDALTQVSGSLSETLEGLKSLSRTDAKLTIKFIPMKPNFKDLRETFELAASYAPGARFVVSGYQMMGEAYTNRSDVSVRFSEIAPYIEEFLSLSDEYGLDTAVAHIPLCSIDPIFWHRYYRGYLGEVIVTPDEAEVECANSRNYDSKPEACTSCDARQLCQWSWFAYSKTYGDNELNPVRLVDERNDRAQ